MFIGHFGVGFAAKKAAPGVSLGSLLLAALFLDLLWPAFLLLGVESVRIVPGTGFVNPFVFEHYPYSHSLLAAVAWGGLVACVYYLQRRKAIGSFVLGGLVVSHWLLDAVVHRPDLPLFPGSAVVAGLSAWSSLPLTLAIEVPTFALGAWLYWRATSPRDAIGRWGFPLLLVTLLGIYAGNLFGSRPPNATAIGWVGQMQWLLILWAYWIDKHRVRSAITAPR